MILKIPSNQFQMELENSSSQTGLNHDDNWCLCNITIDTEIYKGEYLSRQEIDELRNIIHTFYEGNQIVSKKRIAFIKNYMIFYLTSKKDFQKIIQLKLVRLDKKNNYMITFNHQEIEDLISMLTIH